jgi:hypothetical protein
MSKATWIIVCKEVARQPKVAPDATLIAMCRDVAASCKASNPEEGPTNESFIEGRRVAGVIQRIIATQALTLAGLKAKATAYLAVPDDALADALAADVIALS